MAETPKPGSNPSRMVSGELGLAEEANAGAPAMGLGHQEGSQSGKAEASDGFVAIDIRSLSILTAASDKDSTSSPRVQLKKTLSRKGSQRGSGGERKKVAADGDTTTTFPTAGGASACEKSSLLVHVAVEQDSSGFPYASTPTAAGGGGGRCRRLGKRPSPWLDPRRVLVFFATVSSMGTLILLYFTLSMGKMTGGDANAR